MRKILAAFGILATMSLSQTALAGDVFVIGPGMVGHPGADDPSVGFSTVALEQRLAASREAASSDLAAGPLRPWEEAWFQMNQMPGV